MEERLQKVLARAGLASRRAAERLIEEGRVQVNGAVVRELGTKVDAGRDSIQLDGKPIARAPAHHTYLLLNKPRGCMTTLSDPEGRRTVADLVCGMTTRLYPVGRLDFNSEGLLLLTDDGDLAHALMHPSRGVDKTYAVKVRGRPSPQAIERLGRGVSLDGRRTRPAGVRMVRPGPNSWIEVTISEGRKHQVRRMLQSVGHPVVKLRRIAYGGIRLGSLPSGAHRLLSPREVDRLRRATRLSPGSP